MTIKEERADVFIRECRGPVELTNIYPRNFSTLSNELHDKALRICEGRFQES